MKFSFRHVFLLAAFSFGISGGFYAINGYPERYQIICLSFAASLVFIYSIYAEMAINQKKIKETSRKSIGEHFKHHGAGKYVIMMILIILIIFVSIYGDGLNPFDGKVGFTVPK